MPTLDYPTLHRALKRGELASVYYVHGAEVLLKDEAVRGIVDRAVEPAMRDFNLDQRSAAALDPEAVSSLLHTLPMMAERRCVVLRDVDGWQKRARGRAELLRYLERPSPDTVLVMVQGAADEKPDAELAARATVVACDPLPPDRALKWLALTAGQLGVELPDDAAQHLLAAVGNDLGALRAELEKLASLPAGTPVTRDLVGDLVGVRHGETVSDWRDAVLAGDTARAVRLVPGLLAQSGVSGVRLVSTLGTALVVLQLARALHDRGTKGRALEGELFRAFTRARPFGLGSWKEETPRFAALAPAWPPARIRAALAHALDADRALKGTTLRKEEAIVEEVVLRIGGTGAGRQGGTGGDGARRGTMARGAALGALLVAGLLAAVPPFGPSALRAQDLPSAIRLAQEGQADSARAVLARLLTGTAPTDTAYPAILLASALVASDAGQARRALQRVATEYPLSAWADDALLRLGQLEYANGDQAAAARQLEKLRADFPDSPLLADASLWAARSYFALKDDASGCRWLADGLPRAGENVELRNALGFYAPRCAGQAAGRPDGTSGSDTATTARRDSVSPTPAAAPPPAALPSGRPTAFRVQIVAAATEAAATAALARAEGQGFRGVIVREGGFWKVRLGEHATRAEAAEAAKRVKAALGGAPFVVAP